MPFAEQTAAVVAAVRYIETPPAASLRKPKFIEIYANLANEKPTDTRAQGPREQEARKPERDMERLREAFSFS